MSNYEEIEYIDNLIEVEGYNLSNRFGNNEYDYEDTYEVFFEIWEYVKKIRPKDFTNFFKFHEVHHGIMDIQSFLVRCIMELDTTDDYYAEEMVKVCRDICKNFPDTDGLTFININNGLGKALVNLGRCQAADKIFKSLIKSYPKNIWSYIGWGDAYAESKNHNYKKALKIFKKPLGMKIEDVEIAKERVEYINEYKLKNL